MKKEVPTASKSTDNNVGEENMKQLNEPQKHARQIHLDDYLSINESQARDEYGLEDGMLNWFPGREQAAVVKFNGDVFVKKDAVQDFLNRGILFQIGDPCNMRLSYRRPKMLTDVPLFGYTVDFHHFNRLIDEGMTNPTAGGALSLCHYDKECEEVEHELEELESAKTPATMQRFIRELKLTAPQSIEKLEDLGILVPIEKSDNLGDYHETHKSQQNNEK